MRRHDNLLLIAARAPIPGFTKTRLGQRIGMERAAVIYRAFLTDLADRFVPAALDRRFAVDAFDLGWAYTPPGCDFRAVLAGLDRNVPASPAAPIRFVRQEGQDWGDGQLNLLRWGYMAGYERTVLIASDSPHLEVGVVREAFATLEERDVAIGRVHDGGYYLIGLRGFHDVLTGVPMSTSDAADALVARAATLGLRLAELAPTFDVDEELDLDLLWDHLAPDGVAAPATWAALHALGLIPANAGGALLTLAIN